MLGWVPGARMDLGMGACMEAGSWDACPEWAWMRWVLDGSGMGLGLCWMPMRAGC